jgi:hypothetical protein
MGSRAMRCQRTGADGQNRGADRLLPCPNGPGDSADARMNELPFEAAARRVIRLWFSRANVFKNPISMPSLGAARTRKGKCASIWARTVSDSETQRAQLGP